MASGLDRERLADFDLWLRFALLGAAASAVVVGLGAEALGFDAWVPAWATFVAVIAVFAVLRLTRYRRTAKDWSEDSWR